MLLGSPQLSPAQFDKVCSTFHLMPSFSEMQIMRPAPIRVNSGTWITQVFFNSSPRYLFSGNFVIVHPHLCPPPSRGRKLEFWCGDTRTRVSTPLKKSPLPLREGTKGRGAELLRNFFVTSNCPRRCSPKYFIAMSIASSWLTISQFPLTTL